MIYSARKGFTLVELLVVASIICLLAVTGIISYTSINTNARDTRRKADLEQIRAALEMYRSNNGNYPSTTSVPIDCGSTSPFTDVSGNTYLADVPEDPKCSDRKYYYSGSASDYTLAAGLEAVQTACAGLTNLCGASINCSYCVGPYGKK